jgi:hypothetical protein
MSNFQETANFIWQVADDILRGAFKPHEYGDVILPFVVLRRLDCVLEPVKDKVIATYEQFKDRLDEEAIHPVVLQATDGMQFYNTSLCVARTGSARSRWCWPGDFPLLQERLVGYRHLGDDKSSTSENCLVGSVVRLSLVAVIVPVEQCQRRDSDDQSLHERMATQE